MLIKKNSFLRKVLKMFPVGAKVKYNYVNNGKVKEIGVLENGTVDVVVHFEDELEGDGVINLSSEENFNWMRRV